MNAAPELIHSFLHLLAIDDLRALIRQEVRQKDDEGFQITGFGERLENCDSKDKLINIFTELQNLPVDKNFTFSEPDTLTGIHAARPQGPRQVTPKLKSDELHDRIHGGWLGRVSGCVLGKPVEPFGFWGTITEYLQLSHDYPLADYIRRLESIQDVFPNNPNTRGIFKGEFEKAPQDDDTDYSILALHILEEHGLDFTTEQVAAEWLGHLAYQNTFTAERTTYRNLILGISPLEAARIINPEREYIGARIRIDPYGMVVPGNPELAADMAFRDATLSHSKNGIYSAMFTAACIAWAFISNDMDEILQVGLSEIPSNSRLAQAVREVLAMAREIDDWQTARERLLEKNARYHLIHAINNTVLMVLGLIYGAGDLEKTICTAVMCGLDTDCNAANAGTLAGVLSGAQALPHKWTGPLNDALQSGVSGFGEMRISDLARRTAVIATTYLSDHLIKE